MGSPRNDKYNPSYSNTLLSIKCLLRTWFLCFSCFSVFAFWGAEKHVFHILPCRFSCYVLKSIGCLGVRNRLTQWNEGKNLIIVWSKFKIFKFQLQVFFCKFISIFCTFSLFLWCLGKHLTFMCLPLMTSIIFHIGPPNTQENVSYILDFYVSFNVHFSRFEELKITF